MAVARSWWTVAEDMAADPRMVEDRKEGQKKGVLFAVASSEKHGLISGTAFYLRGRWVALPAHLHVHAPRFFTPDGNEVYAAEVSLASLPDGERGFGDFVLVPFGTADGLGLFDLLTTTPDIGSGFPFPLPFIPMETRLNRKAKVSYQPRVLVWFYGEEPLCFRRCEPVVQLATEPGYSTVVEPLQEESFFLHSDTPRFFPGCSGTPVTSGDGYLLGTIIWASSDGTVAMVLLTGDELRNNFLNVTEPLTSALGDSARWRDPSYVKQQMNLEGINNDRGIIPRLTRLLKQKSVVTLFTPRGCEMLRHHLGGLDASEALLKRADAVERGIEVLLDDNIGLVRGVDILGVALSIHNLPGNPPVDPGDAPCGRPADPPGDAPGDAPGDPPVESIFCRANGSHGLPLSVPKLSCKPYSFSMIEEMVEVKNWGVAIYYDRRSSTFEGAQALADEYIDLFAKYRVLQVKPGKDHPFLHRYKEYGTGNDFTERLKVYFTCLANHDFLSIHMHITTVEISTTDGEPDLVQPPIPTTDFGAPPPKDNIRCHDFSFRHSHLKYPAGTSTDDLKRTITHPVTNTTCEEEESPGSGVMALKHGQYETYNAGRWRAALCKRLSHGRKLETPNTKEQNRLALTTRKVENDLDGPIHCLADILVAMEESARDIFIERK